MKECKLCGGSGVIEGWGDVRSKLCPCVTEKMAKLEAEHALMKQMLEEFAEETHYRLVNPPLHSCPKSAVCEVCRTWARIYPPKAALEET